jgi:hypothetical protein
VSPRLRKWRNRSLALLLRPVATDFRQPGAQLRLAGTSCASTGSTQRKAALADHYVAAGDTQTPALLFLERLLRTKKPPERYLRKTQA